jgi:hypothetical protein
MTRHHAYNARRYDEIEVVNIITASHLYGKQCHNIVAPHSGRAVDRRKMTCVVGFGLTAGT